MTSLIFNLDDAVETTNGTRFKISQIWKKPDGSLAYSDFNLRWFSAGDLRLVEEELKIGDWVEVISEGYVKGKILQIKALKDSCGQVLAGNIYFGPDSLRKLTPEEVAKHTGTIGYKTQEIRDEVENAVDAIRNLLAPDVYERLSAIEKQLEEQQKKISQFDGEIAHLIGSIQECLIESGDVEARTKCREMKIEKRLSAIETLQFSQQDAIVHFENRLTFVEKFQRDQDDLIGRAIRDGVVEILDFRRKA